jgi:hypothetical protein
MGKNGIDMNRYIVIFVGSREVLKKCDWHFVSDTDFKMQLTVVEIID